MKKFATTLTAVVIALISTSTILADLTQKISLGDQTLQLNGSGFRTKAFLSIYESGLYLPQPSRDANAIIESDSLMAIRIKITSGMVSRQSLIDSLKESLVHTTNGKPETIAKETQQLIDCLKDEVNKNDVYDFVNIPTKGLYIIKNGAVQGTIPGLEFKKAFYGIWLSDRPVDKDLRQAMLSGTTTR